MQHMFTAVFVEGDSGVCVAYVEELPGAHAQGKDVDEARKNLAEAVELILAANRRVTHESFARARVIRRERIVVGR